MARVGCVAYEDGLEGGVVGRASRCCELGPDHLARLEGGSTDDPQRGGRPYAASTERGEHHVFHLEFVVMRRTDEVRKRGWSGEGRGRR